MSGAVGCAGLRRFGGLVREVDLGVEAHAGGAEHLEEALGEEAGLAGLHLPHPLLPDAQVVGEVALAHAAEQAALLEHPAERLGRRDLAAYAGHGSSGCRGGRWPAALLAQRPAPRATPLDASGRAAAR